MRFKGTWILLLACLGIGSFIYFYEIKGGEEREKAIEAEKRFWMIESKEIQQIELPAPGEATSPSDGQIVAVRKNQEEWTIQAPRTLEADSGQFNRLADAAAEIKHGSILEENASDLAKYGLDSDNPSFKIKTGNGKEYAIFFGNKNPAGNQMYARAQDRNEIFLIFSSLADTFNKNLGELRNHSVLQFEPSEVRTLNIKNQKGDIHLSKDDEERWWLEGDHRLAADSPGIRGILNALSLGKIPEFFDESPDDYTNADMDKPLIEVSFTYGADKARSRLSIGQEKAELRKKESRDSSGNTVYAKELYLARDASRPELFFVEKDLVDELNKSFNDLRNKAIASFQRWDVDSLLLENPNGRFSLTKESGEWFIGDEKKKANFDTVSSILDALESDSMELIDNPADLSTYGLDEPSVRVVLKQEGNILAECSLGKKTEDKVYTRVTGDPSIKAMGMENFEKLIKEEAAFIEKEPEAETEPAEQ